jgi:hypothetical protein
MAFEIYDPKNEIENKIKSVPSRSNIANTISSATGVAARAFEGAAGAPGSLAGLATDVGNYLTGGNLGTYEENRKLYPYLPPTISDLRGSTRNLTGQELEPKTENEKSVQNVAEKLGSSAATGVSFIPNVAMSIGGELVKRLTKSLGAPEWVQLGSEIASELFLGHKLNKRGLRNIESKSYNKLNELTDKSKRIESKVPHTKKAIDDILKKSYLGVSTPGKEFAAKKADEFSHKIRNGKVSFEDFWEFKKSLNNLSHEATIPSGAEDYLKSIGKAVKDDINHLAIKNKQYKTLQTADEIKTAFHRADEAAQLINKRVNELTLGDVTKAGLKSLLLPAIGYGASGTGAAAIGLLATPIKSQTKYFYNLIKNSKDAQRMYGKLVVNALKNNIGELDKSLNGFDKLLNKNSKGFEIYD